MPARANSPTRLDREALAMRDLYRRLGVTGKTAERAIEWAKRIAPGPRADGDANRTASAAPLRE